MWCPYCNHTDTRVIDSRVTSDGMQIRRRRECVSCEVRFNTFETVALKLPNVIKADGSREIFDEDKLRMGMYRALEKRPVETDKVERAIRQLLQEVRAIDARELPSKLVGEWVMQALSQLDQVAYVRFASVYRRFEDVQAFREEIERLEREHPGSTDKRQGSLLDRHPGKETK